MMFPVLDTHNTAYTPHSFRPSEPETEILRAAACADSHNSEVQRIVAGIPDSELLYTWRAANSDADLGGGRSMALAPDAMITAHTLVLNKFLLAADAANAVPITGKPYIHALLAAKFRLGADAIRAHAPDALPTGLRSSDIASGEVFRGIVSALVPDERLAACSFEEIVGFKRANAKLFDRLSLMLRTLLGEIRSLPADASFKRDLADIVNTSVWKEKAGIEVAIRAAWMDSFRDALEESVRKRADKGRT